MDKPKQLLHIALFPWLAFGHIIPYLKLAKLLAHKGHKISFISTPRNIQRLPKIPSNLGSLINLVSLDLPQVENLPHLAESTMDLPSDQVPYLKKAYDLLQDQLLQFLKISTPDWIIYDFSPHWLPPLVAALGIPGAFFSIVCAGSLSFVGSSSSALIEDSDGRTKAEHYIVPPEWIPFFSKLVFRLHEANKFLEHNESNASGVSDFFRVGSVMKGCDVMAVRSCFELEADFLRLLGQLHNKPVLPIGLLPPSALDISVGEADTWIEISRWLDKQKKGSVVYIAFGSESEPNKEEMKELALGLELSGVPFFWALRKQNNEDTAKLPDGFEEKVKERGLVWTSWVPQLKILSHESVGGLLTHCGYSSIIEALHFGRPLVMLPLSLDQGLIARTFEEKKVGVEIKRDEKDGWFTKESVAEALRLVIVENEGTVYRENAKEMMKIFANEQLHDQCVDHFVEFLQNHRRNP